MLQDGLADDTLACAERLADAARGIALAHFRRAIDVETKPDATPVTIADRGIEEAMRAILAERHPAAGVFGEEMGADRSDARDIWVLDPIDGTGAFVTGSPLFGILIGLLRDGEPIVGVIDIPVLGERWTAVKGGGARLNGAPCRTSGRARLAEASLAATSPLIFSEAEHAGFARLADRAALTRFGGDCYAYALVAAGHLDLVVEAGLKPYDYLPIAPVIEEADGIMTDWSGRPLDLESDGRVIAAASPDLHAEALTILQS